MRMTVLFLRSLVFNVFFFYMLFHISMFHRFFEKEKMKLAIIHWVDIIAAGMKKLVKLDYRVIGNIPDTPAIYASRHESTWETVVFFTIFRCCPIVLKKELTQIPLFGDFLRATDMIPVDRAKGTEALKTIIRSSKRVFEFSNKLVIFPEGTRRPPDDTSHINTAGVYAIYKSTNVPVIPIALNSGAFWGRRSFIKLPGTIDVVLLKPIAPGLDKSEFDEVFNKRMKEGLMNLPKKNANPAVISQK